MKTLLCSILCLVATTASARELAFRGDFVETHLAQPGFLDALPAGTKLTCEERLCSTTKSVRIYVFKNKDESKSFWSTDYYDVMFDSPERLLSHGETGHVVYYDETGQLLYHIQAAPETEDTGYTEALYLPAPGENPQSARQ